VLDAIRYINLDARTDRRVQVEHEIQRLLDVYQSPPHSVPPHVARLPGIPTGGVGCCRCHLQATRAVVDGGYRNLLVLEDDFAWTEPPAVALDRMQDFLAAFGDTYGICQIAHTPLALISAEPTSAPGVTRVHRSCYGGGYLISRLGAEALIPIYERAFGDHAGHAPGWEARHWEYMYDVVWNEIKAEIPCYAIEPRLGRQRAGKSDLSDHPWTDYG
jgi:hypothetical protein